MKARTTISQINYGLESLDKIREFEADFQAEKTAVRIPLFKDLVNIAEEGIITQKIELDENRRVKPFRRQTPGNTAIWLQREGTFWLRAGNPKQRYKYQEANPGDVFKIEGRGKRSFENPLSVRGIGFLVSIVPIDRILDELDIQDATQEIHGLMDRHPEMDSKAKNLLDQLHHQQVSPATAFTIAQRLDQSA